MSWSEARVYCEKVGGHLATITSADEQKFIDYLNKGSKSLWIGAYRDEYFLWYWVTGENGITATGKRENQTIRERKPALPSGPVNGMTWVLVHPGSPAFSVNGILRQTRRIHLQNKSRPSPGYKISAKRIRPAN